MARGSHNQLAYQAIRIEGGLVPADELARLTRLEAPEKTEQTESHYWVPKGLKLRDEIARFWKVAQTLWIDFQAARQRQDLSAQVVTVGDFLAPLMRDALGFSDLAPCPPIHVGDHRYNIGYAARGAHLPVVLAAYDVPLDEATERFGERNEETGRTRRRSPFAFAQETLNAFDGSDWAIVSNGLRLRVLRDNPSLTRPAYLEVDLEAIFTEELYADFTALWLLVHASRFGRPGAESTDCAWERWRSAGQEAGVRARERLRDGVAEALRALGTGFLCHPGNGLLRNALMKGEGAAPLGKQQFFEELLVLVYRLIFLATIEDRVDTATSEPLVFAPDAPDDVRGRYTTGYSWGMLRARAARRAAHDRHDDLWEALSITCDGLARGEPALGLPALGGLFDRSHVAHLTGAKLGNNWLLAAIFQLGYFREPAGLTRINYRDMGPEELGSVYESLLELVPDIRNLAQPQSARLCFVGDFDETANSQARDEAVSAKGNTRKLTGSYYTPDILVQELVKSALEPIIEDTVNRNPERPVDALLALTICDPACGSGHFLLASARRLAEEVARFRAPGGVPAPTDYRHALRDVIGHCIYGVDKNPMAIALARTALWLEAYTPDRPLSFLDHHLQCGDALLGVLDPKVLEKGIPDEAFTVLSGDDKVTAAAMKKQNKADLKSWKSIAAGDLISTASLAKDTDAVEHLADDSLDDVVAKRDAWTRASTQAHESAYARLADTYVAAFLAPKLAGDEPSIPLSGYMWGLFNGRDAEPAHDDVTRSICANSGVFHWWLAFPQVAAKGGFSVMLGNPPWERIKLQEEEFFANRSPLVALAKNKDERGKRIELLRQGLLLHTICPDVEELEGLVPPNRTEIHLYRDFLSARRGAEAASLFAHHSGRYPLTGVGDVNTYALFAETFLQLVAPKGRAGFIVPSGIATDDSTKAYFGAVADGRLVSLHDLRTGPGLFSEIGHQRFKFCLLTLGEAVSADFMFFALRVEDLANPSSHFQLTPEEFGLLNPNTGTCPVFRSQRDAEVTKKIYRAVPVLVEEGRPDTPGRVAIDVNPWGIRFSTMFHMSSDSGLFHDAQATLGDDTRLPLYEAKMIHQFDHRWATYVDAPEKPDGLDTQDCGPLQKSDPTFTVRPRYWVDERQVLARIARVPSRVAVAWLAAHEPATTLSRPASSLEFAVASWLAGELYSREAGSFDEGEQRDDVLRIRAINAVQATVDKRFHQFVQLLRSAGIDARRALVDYPRWGTQDANVRLDDFELDELAGCCNCGSEVVFKTAIRDLLNIWMDRRSPRWLMGWRDICRNTDERTVIASVVPRAAVGHTTPLFFSTQPAKWQAALLGNWCAITLDYVARQKVGGTHLTYGYLKQFPVLPPDRYSETDLDFIVPRVLELTYTADDMREWAQDVGYEGPPFGWNPVRRSVLRAELDAYFARLYGLNRDELRYVLDPADVLGNNYPSETFRVLMNNEVRAFGEYRTRRLVLEAWDRLQRERAS